ncbi:MAG: response regulator transcription factor [Acetatifactor sp.]|nr:response regulator transcription factor [Acetatifactor sp.]
MAKILIIEDDTDINNLLAKIMGRQGHEAVQAFSGTEGKLRLELEQYDLMLLDLMLPGMMGEELIREIRRTDPDLPIIVLSAKSALEDRVSVLELGADDYLVKPFAAAEVTARVEGALRRSARWQKLVEQAQQVEAGDRESDGPLQFKDLTLDADRREVRVRGQLLNLTAHEYDILHILMQEPGKVYSRERLYELVWQGGYYGEDNTVNVHVSNLRKKIAAVDSTEYIATVWGIGFRMA